MVSSSRKTSYNITDRKRRMIFEAVACFLIPLIFMALREFPRLFLLFSLFSTISIDYIVQGHRYDIIENLGCQAAMYISIPAIFIIWVPQLLFALITFIYGALALRNFIRHRLTFSSHLHVKTHSNNIHYALTPNRYLRLISMALTEMLWGTALTAFNLYNNVNSGLRPYTSWARVHSNFNRVQMLPMILVPQKNIPTMMLFWWCIPASSIIFFVFFGFGEDAVKEYKRVWVCMKGVLFWRRSARLEKKHPMSFSRLSSSSGASLKPITLKWPPSTSPSTKSPTSMISQSTITITPGQTFDSALEPGTWKRSKSLEFASDSHEFPIPTYYESILASEKKLSGTCSPTSTHHTLIGQLIDPKQKSQIHHVHCHDRSSLGLPEIDESDAFTLDSFSYYEGPTTPCTSSSPPLASTSTSTSTSSPSPPRVSSSSVPSTTRKSLSTTSSTPPHPPSPRLAFSQHSLPPPPMRKEPRAIGSLTSLFRLGANADGVDERGRFSRGDFSFHHHTAQPHARSPLQHETFPHASPSLPDRSTDVPEDVEPSSYIQSLGVLGGVSEGVEFPSGYVSLKRKKTVLGVEGGAISVVIERSASVDEGRVHGTPPTTPDQAR